MLFGGSAEIVGVVVERLEPLLAGTLDRYRGRVCGGEFHFYLHGQMVFLESESINKMKEDNLCQKLCQAIPA